MTTPKIAQKAPYPVDVEEGKSYFWCTCGQSTKQPFCDGSHKDTPYTPVKFTAEQKSAQMCMCKQTKNQPFCDGTHFSLLF